MQTLRSYVILLLFNCCSCCLAFCFYLPRMCPPIFNTYTRDSCCLAQQMDPHWSQVPPHNGNGKTRVIFRYPNDYPPPPPQIKKKVNWFDTYACDELMDSGAVDIRLELQQKRIRYDKAWVTMHFQSSLIWFASVCLSVTVSGLIHLGGYRIFVA